MRTFLRFLIVMLILGIIALFAVYIDRNRVHPLELMEPVEPFAISGAPRVPLEEISASRTLNVAVDGEIVQMELEQYVRCVLAAEMPASFALEALKAQAVAARTLAVYKTMYGGCSLYEGADICDRSDHCQAFCTEEEMKSRWKGDYDEYSEKISLAVAETAGKIITYDDQPILVLYHASSKGYTESVENVYSKALPYLRGVPSPGEDRVTDLEVREEFDRDWFASTVNKAYPKAKLSASKLESQVSVASRYPSGRVEKLKLGGVSVTGVEARRVLGLRSANFTVSFNKYSVIVTTEGYGHGVGMSQTGAQAMALEGNGYIDILTYYYTGVQVVDMK